MISTIGIILGFTAVLLGNFLEGGHLSSLIQPTAAFIVFGGTLGSMLTASTVSEFVGALKAVPGALFEKSQNHTKLIEDLLELAQVARKEGIIALDSRIANLEHPFLKQFLRQIVDGYDPEVLKEMMEDRIYQEEEEKAAAGKVWEGGGGFAPTIGILGAVLGLIHVMGNLSDSSKLGSGIAVAFVATIYGVGIANLVMIPLGNKIKKIAKAEATQLELMKVCLVGIQAGLNPRVIEDQLYNALGEYKSAEDSGGGEQKKAA